MTELEKAALQHCERESVEFPAQDSFKDIADFLIISAFKAGAEWQKQRSEQKWISVKEKLPFMVEGIVKSSGLNTKKVLCASEDGYYFTDCMVKINGTWQWLLSWDIVMWMPIPELPEGGEE